MITVGQLEAGLQILQSIPFGDVSAALADLGNIQKDAVVGEEIANAIAPFVPGAAAAAIAIAVAAWVIQNGTQAKPGALSPVGSGRKGSNPWLPS